MIVSWNWLREYVDLDMSHDELVERLTMSGLNHEGTDEIANDLAIDLEVTSNRPDCLGHIGVAREISVLYGSMLTIPDVNLEATGRSIEELTSVSIKAPELCNRYTARVVTGVKIGPSPSWLAERLGVAGISSINNIVDITNYVMLECGQPLHAFDFQKLVGPRIIVRAAEEGEEFEAIDHRTYKLQKGMCVISDDERAVALGGVMGGVHTEVSASTTAVLIEAAEFAPLSVRSTARSLNLHSPSSYRFERRVDPRGIDWASRRCCRLIKEIAGGQLADGSLDIGSSDLKRDPIVLRLSQVPRVLGIQVPEDKIANILSDLGGDINNEKPGSLKVIAPTWRRDLTREIDLVEEVARIYGYDRIPEDVGVPMAATYRTANERVLEKVRRVLTSAGFDEAMTPSLVPQKWSAAFSPWSDAEPMQASQPMLGVLEKASQNIGKVDLLRRSLLPSLLEARRINEHKSNLVIELFEIAKVYLPQTDRLPQEPWKITITTGNDFFALKGVIESLVAELNPAARLEVSACKLPLLDAERSCELKLQSALLGWIGEVDADATELFSLRNRCTVAEIDLAVLGSVAKLIAQHQPLSPFPAVSRDFNFVVDEGLAWSSLEETVRTSSGPLLESLKYRETFRDPKRDGPGKKRVLLSVTLRSADATLTGEQADEVCKLIIVGCKQLHSADLLA